MNNSGYKFVYLIDAPFPLVVLSAFSKYFVLDLSEKDNNAVPPLEDNDETIGTLSSFVEDEKENKIMTWHALRHWDENIVFGAKIES